MGGKKPIGEHPSRGHLQRRFTTALRRGGHHRAHVDAATEEYEVTPVTQEFSLFSQFDSSPNRFGILSRGENSDAPDRKVESVLSVSAPVHVQEEEKLSDYNIMGEIHSLQYNMSVLIAAFERLQYDFYGGANQAYMYGMYQDPTGVLPTGMEFRGESTGLGRSDISASDSPALKKINERLSTLEGRQKAIQSKISQLDSLYGPNSTTWAKTIKSMLNTSHPSQSVRMSGHHKTPTNTTQHTTSLSSDDALDVDHDTFPHPLPPDPVPPSGHGHGLSTDTARTYDASTALSTQELSVDTSNQTQQSPPSTKSVSTHRPAANSTHTWMSGGEGGATGEKSIDSCQTPISSTSVSTPPISCAATAETT